MNAAKAPGAAKERLRFGGGVILVEPFAPAARIDFAFDGGAQQIEHARNGDEHGGAFAFYGAKNFRGIGGIFENDGGAEQWRNEQRHELSENVAERNQRDEAQRVQEAFVFQIGLDAAFDGFEIGEKISVGEHDAARLGGGAGGEENFGNVLAGERQIREGFIERAGCSTGNRLGGKDLVAGCDVGEILQCEDGNGGVERRLVARRREPV